MLRVEAGLFFANADWVRARIRAAAEPAGIHAVVLDAESVPYIDVTAVQMLDELVRDLARDGVWLLLARDVGLVRDVVRRTSADASFQHVYPSVQAAVDAAQRRA